MMKRFLFTFASALLLLAASSSSPAQQQRASNAPTPAPAAGGAVDVERIVRAFTAKEAEFRQALNNYSFKRDATIQTIGQGGQITGEYRRVSRFVFDDSSRRFEKIEFFPLPTMTEISVTEEDLEDLGGIQPFALETSKAHLYDFKYVGKERIDELDLYVFDVSPKILQDARAVKDALKSKQRFFQGRVWVDQQDLQIVKARGKGVPEDKNNKYPVFETWREQIDGRYWFPTYTYADDELVFGSGQVTRLRARVKYTDFELLKGRVRIIEEGEPGVDDPESKPAKPAPTPQARPKP